MKHRLGRKYEYTNQTDKTEIFYIRNFCNFLIQIKVNLIFYLNYFQLVISFPTKLFKKIVNAFVCLPRRKKNYTDSKLVYAVNDPQLDNSIDFLKVNNADQEKKSEIS